MSQENVQAARGLYDAFNRGDLNAFENGCSREFVWNEAENSLNAAGNPYRNFKQVLEGVFQPTKRDFDGFRCDLEKLLDAGDTIIGTGRYRGKRQETGKQLSAQFCHVLHFDRDARLDGVQEYTDTLQEAEVAGRVQQVERVRIIQPAM
ncbi:MAG TPA: nuclear transport factor 2 family protein [Sphingomicrobium sp.]